MGFFRSSLKEYFLYDLRGDYLTPLLQGYRLRDGEYLPLLAGDGAAGPWGGGAQCGARAQTCVTCARSGWCGCTIRRPDGISLRTGNRSCGAPGSRSAQYGARSTHRGAGSSRPRLGEHPDVAVSSACVAGEDRTGSLPAPAMGAPQGTSASSPRNQLHLERPVRDQPLIDLAESIEGHRLGQNVQLVAEQAGGAARGQGRSPDNRSQVCGRSPVSTPAVAFLTHPGDLA